MLIFFFQYCNETEIGHLCALEETFVPSLSNERPEKILISLDRSAGWSDIGGPNVHFLMFWFSINALNGN